MVLVNNPGTWAAVYPPLRHAAWHGWTPTDMVFPFFVFIVGVAVPFALGPRLERSEHAGALTRVVRRSAIIFALGIILQGSAFDWATLRIPGVLQRIALCYLAGGGWRRQPPTGATAARLALVGVLCAAGGEFWGAWFPVNKSLWTSSYVMLMGGLALITLAACYWLIEVRGYRRWAVPFVVFGVNALALYFLSTAVARALVLIHVGPDNASLQSVLFNRLFAPWASPANASLAYACAYVLVWLGLMWLLSHRRQ